MIDRVSDGIHQIDRGDCDQGFVFLNLKNIIDRTRYWPGERDKAGGYTWGAFGDPAIPLRLLLEEIDSLRGAVVSHVGGSEPLVERFWIRRRRHPQLSFMPT